MDKKAIKSVVISAAFGGLVYAIMMSLFYQFFNEEYFNIKKFAVDFLLFAVIIAAVNYISHKRRNKK